MTENSYTLELDLNVLNHLGIGLYSNTPAVLTEIVANSWDADAKKVEISINVKESEIEIQDDGHGMNPEDIQAKFLTVGYARRLNGEEYSPNGRQCMGRKGIGKLAMFSLATEIIVYSKKKHNNITGFSINVEDLKKSIRAQSQYRPKKIDITNPNLLGESGTLIKLKNLNKQINRTESYLKKRLARRFSVIGEAYDFKVFLNNTEITIADRGVL